MKTRATISAALPLLALALLAPSCAIRGPAALHHERADYNVALQQSRDEQMLLNIVRLKYRDSGMFLDVTAINSRFSFEATGGADTSLRSGTDTPLSLSSGLTWAEEPTVTYTPLGGEQYVTQLLSPIELSVLALVCNSGWSIERVLRACVERLGGLPNAPNASGPTPERAPRFERFREAARLLRAAQVRDALQVGLANGNGGSVMHLRLEADALRPDEAARLVELLGPADDQGVYTLASAGAAAPAPGVIDVTTRSMMQVLSYLSEGVEAPEPHRERGLVTHTRREDGQPFDWSEVLEGLLRIRSSETRPADAHVAVAYRGVWFYLDDADLDSKTTFMMTTLLFALQAGDIKGTPPSLTLSVGS